LKGFPGKIHHAYNRDVLWRLCAFSLVCWDGETYNNCGFTALLLEFLRSNPTAKVAAFREQSTVDSFLLSWEALAQEFPDRIALVAVNLIGGGPRYWSTIREDLFRVQDLDGDDQDHFIKACLGLKLTRATQVFALGGTGIEGKVAEVSLADGVRWTIFPARRAWKELTPSLLDWAEDVRGRFDPSLLAVESGQHPQDDDAYCRPRYREFGKNPHALGYVEANATRAVALMPGSVDKDVPSPMRSEFGVSYPTKIHGFERFEHNALEDRLVTDSLVEAEEDTVCNRQCRDDVFSRLLSCGASPKRASKMPLSLGPTAVSFCSQSVVEPAPEPGPNAMAQRLK
jgi:hypothetical protein